MVSMIGISFDGRFALSLGVEASDFIKRTFIAVLLWRRLADQIS
jgi:hypothetical protein